MIAFDNIYAHNATFFDKDGKYYPLKTFAKLAYWNILKDYTSGLNFTPVNTLGIGIDKITIDDGLWGRKKERTLEYLNYKNINYN
jgi:hypothetical protein